MLGNQEIQMPHGTIMTAAVRTTMALRVKALEPLVEKAASSAARDASDRPRKGWPAQAPA
jgi:hypothetical protein